MSLVRLGSSYGGWVVDLDILPEGTTVISAGVGEDISFDEELIRLKNCNIIGIDPTEKSVEFIKSKNIPNFTLLEKALWVDNDGIELFYNSNPDHVSESILSSHQSVTTLGHKCDTISIPQLLKDYDNISLLKMDVEGAEYDIINRLEVLEVPQLCVEFHWFCSNRTKLETADCIAKIISFGYELQHVTPSQREYSFKKV